MMQILHLTDLHLKDINSSAEKLRAGFYEEFIDGLAKEIKDKLQIYKFDYIFCTGDFVDQGSFHNYAHAKSVLYYIKSKFDIEENKIAICIGNHDYDQKIDGSGDVVKAREEFLKFSLDFNFGDIIKKESFYSLHKCIDDYVLIFDSTIGSNGVNKPSTLADSQIDEVINTVSRNVPLTSKLFVLSHYPMMIFNRSQQHLEEIGWVDKHLWKSGAIIVERIFNKRENALTMWFCGDGHVPDFTSINQHHHFLMTGMIGGNYTNPTFKDKNGIIKSYNKFSEVKVISIDSDLVLINTISYKSKGHEFSPHSGSWEASLSQIRIEENAIVKNKTPIITDSPKVDKTDQVTELMGSSVQTEIIETIRTKSLYLFNRFSTSEDEVSLGWISIQRLFENKELLSRCIDKSIEWLKKEKRIDISDCMMIGVDFWGSIFASQISIRENAKNYIVATRHDGKRNVEFEKIDFLCDRIKTHTEKYFIIITDVVATGNTVRKLKEKIESSLQSSEKKWILISILSDKNQKRNDRFKDFYCIGTLCSDLLLPLLKTSELPDESILPIRFDLK